MCATLHGKKQSGREQKEQHVGGEENSNDIGDEAVFRARVVAHGTILVKVSLQLPLQKIEQQ